MSGISPTKKRKANDSRVAASDDDTRDVQTNGGGSDEKSPPTQSNLSQRMDTMMQIMLRMEEKCNRLEAKCNSLETIVKEQADLLDVKIDKKFKQHEYNDMLVRNQSWKYSAPVLSEEEYMKYPLLYDDYEAEYLSETGVILKEATESLRRGEFPDQSHTSSDKGIYLTFDDTEVVFRDDVNDNLLPHWREFASALKQFTPAFGMLPDGLKSFLSLDNLQLQNDSMMLMEDALMNKPFHSLAFNNNFNVEGGGHDCGMSVDAIVSIIDSNKQLRRLEIGNNRILGDGIRKICSSVHNHPSLVDLDLRNCFEGEGGIGDEMMISLLTSGTLKLETLQMSYNGITSNVTTLLSDFLATDPPLKGLQLTNNSLNDNDAVLLANALRSNTSLKWLHLQGMNSITDVSREAFRLVLNDDSSLNSVSDSNHKCYVGFDERDDDWNMNFSYDRGNNRARKIYRLLSSRHKSVSNAQHFGDIDVKFLPKMVGAVQKYASFQVKTDVGFVKELSIVYELMRKWDKVFSLFM